jgi:hypothetical protein
LGRTENAPDFSAEIMKPDILRRYTNLPAALRILRQSSITLLPSDTWDDTNDRRLLQAYKDYHTYKSVLALCFSSASETYHHWKVFSPGTDGVCIVFNKESLLTNLPIEGVSHGPIEYYKVEQLSPRPPGIEKIPFAKRIAYQDEREYRFIFVDRKQTLRYKDIEIPQTAVNRILVNPWLPEPLFDEVKYAIQSIRGFSNLQVAQSRVTDGPAWKRLADELTEL